MKPIFKPFWIITISCFLSISLGEELPSDTSEDTQGENSEETSIDCSQISPYEKQIECECKAFEGKDKADCYTHFAEQKRNQNKQNRQSAHEKAKSESQNQMILSTASIGGSVYAFGQSVSPCAIAYSGKEPESKVALPKCIGWLGLGGALGGTGIMLLGASGETEGVANDFTLGFPDPRSKGKSTTSGGDPTKPPDRNKPTHQDIPPWDQLDPDSRKRFTTTKTELGKLGIKIDPNGKIKMPDGTVLDSEEDQIKTAIENLPANKVNALKNHMANLKKNMIAKMNENNGEIKTDQNKKTSGSGGGGGGFKGYGGSFRKKSRRLSSLNNKPKSLLTAGLNKKQKEKFKNMAVQVGTHKVGISQNNIFQMVHDRYQSKRKIGGFKD